MKNLVYLLIVFLLTACSSNPKAPDANVASGDIRYAKGFSIEENEYYTKLVILNPWNNYEPYANYFFLKDSTHKPNYNPKELNFFFSKTPDRIALHSAAQAYSLKILEVEKKVKGITDPQLFYTENYQKRLEAGELLQTSSSTQINKEQIMLLRPDLVIISGWRSIPDDYQQLINMGFPPLFMMEWMETEPLGRAEWLKVLGLFLDKLKQADSLFDQIEANYLAIKSRIGNFKNKPLIIHGEEYNGVWYVAGGQSYTAKMYADAGANYLWKEDQNAGSLGLDIEVVLNKGANADFWFTTFGSKPTEIDHLKQEKYAILKAVKHQQIYSNTKRTNAAGGNDFWETGNIRPDIILKDIAKILHPDLFVNDSLFFYKKLIWK